MPNNNSILMNYWSGIPGVYGDLSNNYNVFSQPQGAGLGNPNRFRFQAPPSQIQSPLKGGSNINWGNWINTGASLVNTAANLGFGINNAIQTKRALDQAEKDYNETKALRDKREKERDEFNASMNETWKKKDRNSVLNRP